MSNRLTVPTKKSFQSVLQMAAVLYLLVWSIAPPLQLDMIFRLLALGLAFVWFFLEFFQRFEFTPVQIWCALFMVGVALIAFIQGGAGAIMGEIAVFMMVLAYFINIYSVDSWQNYRIVVPITIGLLLFFNYRTVSALELDPSIARRLVRNSEELYVFMRRGVGGYGLIYPQVCIAPVIYAWTLKSFEYNKLYFVLGIAWGVSFWMLLNNAGYSIAIFAAGISLFLLIFYRRRSVVPAIIISVALFVAVVLLLVYVESFRNVVLKIFEGTKVVRKIEDLLETAAGETADSFSNRVERYWKSLKTCFRFPLIGGILFGGEAGGHSEILDTFAKYGVWGGVPTFLMIFHAPNAFKKAGVSSTILATANAHLVAVALVAFFDPFVFNVYFPLLILCPVMYTDIMKWTGELHESVMDG